MSIQQNSAWQGWVHDLWDAMNKWKNVVVGNTITLWLCDCFHLFSLRFASLFCFICARDIVTPGSFSHRFSYSSNLELHNGSSFSNYHFVTHHPLTDFVSCFIFSFCIVLCLGLYLILWMETLGIALPWIRATNFVDNQSKDMPPICNIIVTI